MDDKVFNLLEKMYGELTAKIDSLDNKLQEVKAELKQDIAKTNILIEHDVKPKLEALFDGYKQNTENLKEILNRIDEVSDKVDNHDIKIQVIEGGKRA